MTDTERERITAICEVAGVTEIDDLSDGFHTFRQLYYQRMMLFATIVKQNKDKAWKSLRHEDGELCFGGGWFIVGIDTPEGSYTYHYEDNYYSLFDCEELERGKHWDGHTEKDVARLLSLPKAQLSQEGTTKDAISRQAAIDAVNNAFDRETLLTGFVHSIAVRAIRDMPSAQPERKTGRWVSQKGGGYCCSECGRYALDEVDGNFIHVAFESNFCPYCGAKMERRTDE